MQNDRDPRDQNADLRTVCFCLKWSVVAFRGQNHFAPEIFKMSYLCNYATKCVYILLPVMANNHNISEMQTDYLNRRNKLFKIQFQNGLSCY